MLAHDWPVATGPGLRAEQDGVCQAASPRLLPLYQQRNPSETQSHRAAAPFVLTDVSVEPERRFLSLPMQLHTISHQPCIQATKALSKQTKKTQTKDFFKGF